MSADDSDAAQKQADWFNVAVPIGTVVRYWRGLHEGPASGTGKTRSTAAVLYGHTAVVWIEGCVGCVAISHVEVDEVQS